MFYNVLATLEVELIDKEAHMRTKMLVVALAVVLGVRGSAFGQDTTVVARIGMRDAATYHFAEVIHEAGNWVFPDVGCIDFAKDDYREIFTGAGRTLVRSKHLTIVEEVYFVQATGPAAKSARYVQFWTLLDYALAPRLIGQTVYFPYIPLNGAGRRQHVIERAKLEYVFPHFKVGAGYGAYQFGDGNWQNKPFVTVTLKGGPLGSMELWLQRVPAGMQLQARYARVFK